MAWAVYNGQMARFTDDDRSRMVRIERMLRILLRMEDYIMASLDRLRTAVAAERTVTQSVVVLLNDISQRLKDAIASGDQEALDALAADLEGNKDVLAAAVQANTPGGPVVNDPGPGQPNP